MRLIVFLSLRGMQSTVRTFLVRFLIVAVLTESGCGLIQLASHSPNISTDTPTGTTHKSREWNECLDELKLRPGVRHSVFCFGDKNEKPPLLLLHELNGLTEDTFDYAAELSKDFTVYLPMLFGEKGKDSQNSGLLTYWLPWGEWAIPSEGSAPVVDWLREVVSTIHAKHPLSKLRIIGNCMTGALPLALLNDKTVHSIVLAQPALPIRVIWPYSDKDLASLGLSNTDQNVARNSKAKVFSLRFETDWISHVTKQKTLEDLVQPSRLIKREICSTLYQSDGGDLRPHSTLIGGRYAGEPIKTLSIVTREEVLKFLLDVGIESNDCAKR